MGGKDLRTANRKDKERLTLERHPIYHKQKTQRKTNTGKASNLTRATSWFVLSEARESDTTNTYDIVSIQNWFINYLYAYKK